MPSTALSSHRSRRALVLFLALALLAGAAHAVDFGTTEVGDPVDRVVWNTNVGGWATFAYGFISPGYTIVSTPPGAIPPFSSFGVTVRLLASTPGTFNGQVDIGLSNFTSYSQPLTGTVTPAPPPCGTPTVSVTSPTSGSTQSPNHVGNVILEANASDSSGISRVELFVDGALVATDISSPYAFAWPAKQGSHTVTAKAYNSCGNSRTSSGVSFTVDCGPLTVTVTSPADGATVSPNHVGNVILEASASHSTGIREMRFFVNGIFQQTDFTAPYAWAWPAVSGQHIIAARAFSNCGNGQTSSNRPKITVVP